jgi:hypothetical protein
VASQLPSHTAYNLVLSGTKPTTPTTPVELSTSYDALIKDIELLARTSSQDHVATATKKVVSRSVFLGVLGLGPLPMAASQPASNEGDVKRPSRLLNLNKSPKAQKLL